VVRDANRFEAITLNGARYDKVWIRQGSEGSTQAPPVGADPRNTATASWGTTATEHRGKNGKRFSYACPSGGSRATVWGTDVYTDDSSICTAAVHAGLINLASGGVVVIEVLSGRSSYTASTRNGIPTSSYGSYVGSFRFAGAGGAASQVVDREIFVQLPPPPMSIPTAKASWGTTASHHRERNGQRFNFQCPPGGIAYTVWGTDIFTDDSSVCTAAVHFGAISFRNGGTVTIEILPGQEAYAGSERSGVKTSSYGRYVGSYRIVGAARN
jgi:hypothetical protein